MINDEFKDMCRVAWSKKYNYLCFDKTQTRKEGKCRKFNESKTTYIECICESEPF